MNNRLLELDGLPAFAALAVVFFHYFHRFREHQPWDETLVPLARLGDLGVHLFFIISGVVIAGALRRVEGLLDFALRRGMRLWPAMIVCALATCAIAHLGEGRFIAERPPQPSWLLPSWTFTAPGLWTWLDPDVGFIDGVYWTLFVELRFYILAAAAWFLLGARRFTPVFFVVGVLVGLATGAAGPAGVGAVEKGLRALFIGHYIHLFCAGILFHEFLDGRGAPRKAVALAVCAAMIPLQEPDWDRALTIALFFAVFSALILRPGLLRPLRWRWAVWIGWASYPLYLVHQKIGVMILTWLPEGLPAAAYLSAGLGLAGVMVLAALAIHLLVERPAQRSLRAAWAAARA